MPSKSKAQHRFMGAVLNCKKTGDCPSKKIREAADSMTTKEIMDFLKTKETHLHEADNLCCDLSASTRWIFPALNRYFGSN
jgi:hypothetical protein